MSRPLRFEFPGAVYHVTPRGDRREEIYRDDVDRTTKVEIVAQAMNRFDTQVLAYCLTGNHYHLVLHTRSGNLSRLMRHVNGVYTQAYNRRHGLVGHLFQGRFKAVLVDRDVYLPALCRYVERNPVAARLVQKLAIGHGRATERMSGRWSRPHGWMSRACTATFWPAGRSVRERTRACQRYAASVARSNPRDADFWNQGLHGQISLGDEAFAERMQALALPERIGARETPSAQRRPQPASWQALLGARAASATAPW